MPKLTTPLGKELELCPYITAQQRNELRAVYLEKVKINSETGQAETDKISGAIIDEIEKKMIQLCIISYDGNKENILERLLTGDVKEYDFAVAECNKLNQGVFTEAK